MNIFSFRRVVASSVWASAVALGLVSITSATAAPVLPPRVPHVPKPTFTVYVAGQTPGFSSGAAPYSIVGGPDGNVWFTETGQGNGNGAVAKLSPSTGTVTEYPTGPSQSSRPLAIAVGGDGNVWFTDLAKRAIGRITPSGTITEFTQGISSDDEPAGLTAAPDGTLWFVSKNTGPYVGHVALNGTITEVAHFDASLTANPSIGADTSGNLWFTGSNGNLQEFLGEVTAQGVASTNTLKLESIEIPCCVIESTQAFATDANGSLWFTNLFYGRPSDGRTPFGRIDDRLSFVGQAGGTIASIALGSDKRLWFANQSPFFTNASIGTIERNGRLQNHFLLPSKTSPISIAGGPDGNLWLTATNGSAGLIIKATP